MAKDSEDQRFFGGPRPLGALVPRLTRPAFKKKSPAGAQLMADWHTVVGPALAAVTTPKRFATGTLTIGCSGPMAMELSYQERHLIERINGHFGKVLVERLRFVQQAPSGAAAPRRPAPPVVLPPRVGEAISAIPGEELREALAKLGRGVYRKRS
jgi:hypothetical protein